MPAFLGGMAYVRAQEDEPGAFLDGHGLWWKPRKRGRLVQPDEMAERGPETVVWREPKTIEQRLAELSPPPGEPEDLSGLFEALPEPEPEPMALPQPSPLVTGDRVPVTNWRRIEFPRPPHKERNKDAA